MFTPVMAEREIGAGVLACGYDHNRIVHGCRPADI